MAALGGGSDQAADDAALAGYGDAVDTAVRVPTLAGAAAALLLAAIVTLWRVLRRRMPG